MGTTDFSYQYHRTIAAGAAEAVPADTSDPIVWDLAGYSRKGEGGQTASLLLLAVGDSVDYEVAFWNGTSQILADWVIAAVGTLTDGTPAHITFPYQGSRVYIRKTNVTGADVVLYAAASPVDVPGAGGGGGGAGDASEATLSAINVKTPTLGQKTMAGSSPVVIASNQSPVPVDVSSSALPTGAATEVTLAALNAKIPALGQATMANSLPMVIASNQSAIPITVATVPLPTGASTEATLSALNTKVPSQGQATMAASMPVVIASNQSGVPVTNAGITSIDGKLPAALGQTTMAGSLSVVLASNQSAVPISGSITASNPSVDATGGAIPAEATYIGGVYGGNLHGIALANADTGGTAPRLLTLLGVPGVGGPTVVTSADPLPVAVISGGGGGQSEEQIGQPVPTHATYIGGNYGGNIQAPLLANGRTDAGDSPSLVSLLGVPGVGGPTVVTASDPLPVTVISGGGGGQAEGQNGAAAPTYSVQGGGTDGTNLRPNRAFNYDTGGTSWLVGFGLMLPGAGGPVAGGTSTNPVRVDPTGVTAQPITAASLPLPTGAATEATLAAMSAKLPAALGQTTMANSLSVAIASNQGTLTVGGTAADDAAASGNPVQVGGVYRATPATMADGDAGSLLLDAIRRLRTANVGSDDTADVQKVAEANPLSQRWTPSTYSVAAAGGSVGNNDYYFTMDGYKSGGIQIVQTVGGSGNTLVASVQATCQDDGTAAASCNYVDVGTAWFGSDTFASSQAWLLTFVDKPIKFLRVRIAQGVNTNGAWSIYLKRVW